MSILLRRAGIISSISLGIIFIAAAVALGMSVLWPEADLQFLDLFSNIWLIKIFRLQAGIVVNQEILRGIFWIDILILVLFIVICLSLLERKKYHYKIWFVTACFLLVLGITIFIITKLAGRSSFMASGMIISSLFFTEIHKRKLLAIIGVLANALLLTGDFTVGSGINIIPLLFAVGYLLLIYWIFMVTRLFKDDTAD